MRRRHLRCGSPPSPIRPPPLDPSQAMSGTAAVCECDPVDFPQHSERWLPDAAPALTLRVPDFTAELDPTPFLDLMPQAPARCDKWMHAPAPELVAAFVRASAELEPTDAPHVLRFGTELNPTPFLRSEERRVGKECRSRWSPYH